MRRAASVLIRNAILTLAALPDRERSWLASPRSSLPEYVREAVESYGYQEARARFRPTPKDIDRCLDSLAWLSWLGRQPNGKRDVKIITARAFATPLWKVAQRLGKSEETIRRWENDALDAIAAQFRREIMAMADE